MKFEFIGNAGGIFHGSKGTTVLCDPWIVDGVFEGSWCHYPPLTTKVSDLQHVDAIYLSHIHPDHYDDRYFDFPKSTPIFALDHGPAFLIKNLQKAGYTNIIRVKDGETVTFREYKVTLFAPFAKHNFHDADVGNLIDSAIVLEDNGMIALNANDNTPTPESCIMLRERFGHVDLAMINYNAAGPYPSCFNNLTLEEKHKEHQRILGRNFDYTVELVNALKPRFILPFAGAYVLGGRLHEKNAYLGTTSWEECAAFLAPRIPGETQAICLRERDTFDIATGTSSRPYVPLDANHMKQYIQDTLSVLRYPYEADAAPDLATLKADLAVAAVKMRERMGRLKLQPKMQVMVDIGGESVEVWQGTGTNGSLKCSMDNHLLRRILDRTAHWNNAEIGCHIEFVRTPNTYEPDLHTALQFLHL